MLKRFFSLALLSVFCMLAGAKMVEDCLIDYRTTPWDRYPMGYIPSQDKGWLTITQPHGAWEYVDGDYIFTPNADNDGDGLPDPGDYRMTLADFPTVIGFDYTVTVYGKADLNACVNMDMVWGTYVHGDYIPETINFTTEWSEISVTYHGIGDRRCTLYLHPGSQETTFEIQWIKVTHNESDKPVEWIDLITNGNAEGEYGDPPCAYSLEYGYNNNEPHPAFIEEVDGGHAFVCHATAMVENYWDNMFYIFSPKPFKKGDRYRVTFDCKASKAGAYVTTQEHAYPGNYLHWYAIGNIDIPTEWETRGGISTVQQDGMYSLALCLNHFEGANDYYFDNIKWEILKWESGYFAAGDFCDKVLDDAIPFVYDPENRLYVCVVGTPEKPASNLKISTKCGNDISFSESCINFDTPQDDGDEVYINDGTGNKWVDLPWPGIWRIELYEEFSAIDFYEIPADEYNHDWADEIETTYIEDGLIYRYTDDTHSAWRVTAYTRDLPTSVEIPSTIQGLPVTGIDTYSFEECTSMTSVTIPETVTSIDARAFSHCDRLSAFYGKYASEGNRCLVKDGNLIGFAPADLTTYTIPGSVTSIGNYAFYCCHNLISLTIPESVTSFGEGAFYLCDNLKSMTIPESVVSIGSIAFYFCSGLTSVIIPESVTSIGKGAFMFCRGLTSLTLPPYSEIGYNAFCGLSNLQEVYATGSIPIPISVEFGDTPIGNCTLYVPKGARGAYVAAEIWSDFGNIVEVGTEEPYSLQIGETEVIAEQLTLIPVSLANEGGVKGLQCDIHLPAGVVMAPDEFGDAYIERSNRTRIHNFGINFTDGRWRITCTNMRNIEIPAGDGVLFYIPVIADDNPADLTLAIDNIYLSLTGDVLQPVAPTEGLLHILPAYIPGDADGDRSLTVADFTFAISHILGMTVEGFNFRAADIDCDGQVLIADATAILSLVLESGAVHTPACSAPTFPTAAKTSTTTLPVFHLSEIQADFNSTATASFSIDCASNYAAAQFDLLLPQGVTVLDVRIADSQKHQVLFSSHEGSTRVVVFSTDNVPLRSDHVLDITFGIVSTVDGAVSISNGLVVEIDNDNIRKYAATGDDTMVCGIDTTAGLHIAIEGRTLLITASQPADIVLTASNGVNRRISLHPGLNRIPLHASGVYILGNRKIIIR